MARATCPFCHTEVIIGIPPEIGQHSCEVVSRETELNSLSSEERQAGGVPFQQLASAPAEPTPSILCAEQLAELWKDAESWTAEVMTEFHVYQRWDDEARAWVFWVPALNRFTQAFEKNSDAAISLIHAVCENDKHLPAARAALSSQPPDPLYCDVCGSELQRESCNHVRPCPKCSLPVAGCIASLIERYESEIAKEFWTVSEQGMCHILHDLKLIAGIPLPSQPTGASSSERAEGGVKG